MVTWSSKWKASTRPRKQRNYRFKAPLHIKQKMTAVHLAKPLREKYGKRSLAVRKGDKVKILRGQFKGKTGDVITVKIIDMKVVVEGIENIRKDGTKSPYLLEPSNMMITELNLEDKRRKESLERKGAKK